MFRNVIFLLGLLSIVACAPSYQVKRFSHPLHGEGNRENQAWLDDIEECKLEVYTKGVFVNSQKVTDLEEIEKLDAEYMEWMKTEAITAVKERRKMGYVPVRFQDMDRARSDRGKCIREKGWSK